MLAETIALLYLYYYLQDVVHYRDPGHGQLILVLIATVAAIIATVAVGASPTCRAATAATRCSRRC